MSRAVVTSISIDRSVENTCDDSVHARLQSSVLLSSGTGGIRVFVRATHRRATGSGRQAGSPASFSPRKSSVSESGPKFRH